MTIKQAILLDPIYIINDNTKSLDQLYNNEDEDMALRDNVVVVSINNKNMTMIMVGMMMTFVIMMS